MRLEEYIQNKIYEGALKHSDLVGIAIRLSYDGFTHETLIADVQMNMCDLGGDKAQCESITVPLASSFVVAGVKVNRLSYSLVLAVDKLLLCCESDAGGDSFNEDRTINSGFEVLVILQ